MSLAMLIFWSSESIPAKVTAISVFLHPKMEKFTISHQSPSLTEISLFDYGHVILVHTFLARP